jgi:hypothetical protein
MVHAMPKSPKLHKMNHEEHIPYTVLHEVPFANSCPLVHLHQPRLIDGHQGGAGSARAGSVIPAMANDQPCGALRPLPVLRPLFAAAEGGRCPAGALACCTNITNMGGTCCTLGLVQESSSLPMTGISK